MHRSLLMIELMKFDLNFMQSNTDAGPMQNKIKFIDKFTLDQDTKYRNPFRTSGAETCVQADGH